jgi:hypothetical protein
MHRHLHDARGVRKRLGTAETRPSKPPTGAPQKEISPARQAARGHLEDIRATLARLDGHFDGTLPSASPGSGQAGAIEGQPRSAVSREARQIFGEAHSGETQQRSGPHQGLVAASKLETNAERPRRAIASSGGLSDHLPKRESKTARVRAQVEARDALRWHDEQPLPGLDVYESQRDPPRPGWAEAPGRELSPQEEQALRDELRSQWENRPRAGLVSRPPLKAVPKSQRPGLKHETLVQDVIERGRSGRPIAD